MIEDYFDNETAQEWLKFIFQKGQDELRGFHHPDVKPNRFHAKPKYPVKKYMCFGLYWNPLDYIYYPVIPDNQTKPFPVPKLFQDFCQKVLEQYYPIESKYWVESIIVNFYINTSSMGAHVDKDEEDHTSPVIGVSFGSTCRFLYEDTDGVMKDIKIPANSVYIFGKEARLMKHGVGTVYAQTVPQDQSKYFESKERLNLTFRKVYQS